MNFIFPGMGRNMHKKKIFKVSEKRILHNNDSFVLFDLSKHSPNPFFSIFLQSYSRQWLVNKR